MKKSIITVCLVLILLAGGWGLKNQLFKSPEPMMPVEIPKQVTYSFTLRNKTNMPITHGRLWVSAPVSETSFQRCPADGIEAGLPFDILPWGNGNQALSFVVTDLAPYGTRVVQVRAALVFQSGPGEALTGNDAPYLSPEPHIQSDHPDIAALARTLSGQTPVETAENIYKWVSSNIRSAGYIRQNRGALYALEKRQGDCTEFMSLFVALCRAVQVPARGAGGYVCPGNCRLAPSGYHNWAEFKAGGVWRIADCQKKVFDGDQDQYITMEVLGADLQSPMKGFSRFRFQGQGLAVHMN